MKTDLKLFICLLIMFFLLMVSVAKNVAQRKLIERQQETIEMLQNE